MSWRTCTGPKLLLRSRISRMGSVTDAPSWSSRWPDPMPGPATVSFGGAIRPLLDARAGAGGLDALADLGDRERARVHDVHHVGLGDDLGRQQQCLQVVVRRLRVGELGQGQAG